MAQPLVPAILPALDMMRTLGGRLGLRAYTIRVRRRVSQGVRPGVGPYTDLPDIPLVNQGTDGFTCPVQVEQVSRNDVIASGGRYQAGDWRIGPMTPAYVAQLAALCGGYTDETLDPPIINAPVEIFWLMTGPTVPTDSVLEKVGEEGTAMHTTLVMRMTGRVL